MSRVAVITENQVHQKAVGSDGAIFRPIQYSFFDKMSYESLGYVYDAFLSTPFPDVNAPRGTYIDKAGTYRSYPLNQPVKKDSTEVYRPNHGLAHNVRVTAKVRNVIAFYADPKDNKNPISRRWFERFNEDEQRGKLEIAGSFYVACRGSEAGFNPMSDSPYQRYRLASSEAFYTYAKELTKPHTQEPLFTKDELTLYQTVLRDPYFDKKNDLIALNSRHEEKAQIAAAKAVLSSCHALDLARCFHVEKMNHKISEVLDPLGNYPCKESYQKTISLFEVSEIQHILTGNRMTSALDDTEKKFIELQALEKKFLFRLCGTDPEIAIRCVSLSKHVHDINIARTLALSLNRYALKGAEELKQFLTRIENCFTDRPIERLDTIFQEEKTQSDDTSTGRIFKIIRNDDYDFWDDFASETVNPSIDKPELRETKNKDTEKRKPFTVKLKNEAYQIVPTNKEEKRKITGEAYNEQDKKTFTRHQSTSYSNYQVGYNPPCFGHNNLDRAELLVGVSFSPIDCQLKRIMMYDGGTFARPYDFDSKEEAELFIKDKMQRGIYHTTLTSLQEKGLTKAQNRHNEIMAKLQWTSRSSISVFSDNLKSRLLAQVRALDLKKRFEEKLPDREITIPITIYPDFSDYSPEHQTTDKEEAKKTPNLKKYVIALELLKKEQLNENFFLKNENLAALEILAKTNMSIFRSVTIPLEKIKNTFNFLRQENKLNWVSQEKQKEVGNTLNDISLDGEKATILTHLKKLNEISLIIEITEKLNADHNTAISSIDSKEKLTTILKFIDKNNPIFQGILDQALDIFLDTASKKNKTFIRNLFAIRCADQIPSLYDIKQFSNLIGNIAFSEPSNSYPLLINLYKEKIFGFSEFQEIANWIAKNEKILQKNKIHMDSAISRDLFSLSGLFRRDNSFSEKIDLLNIGLKAPWASLTDSAVTKLFNSMKSATDVFKPSYAQIYYFREILSAVEALKEYGIEDTNASCDFLSNAVQQDAIVGYTTILIFLHKTKLLDAHFETIKELNYSQIHFLSGVLKASDKDNSSEDLLNNALSAFEKNKYYTYFTMENYVTIFIFLYETKLLDTYFEKIKELSDDQIDFLDYLLKAFSKDNFSEVLLKKSIALFESNEYFDYFFMKKYATIFIFLHEMESFDVYFEKFKQLSYTQICFLSNLLEAFDKNNPPKGLLNNALSLIEKNKDCKYSVMEGYVRIFVFLYETKLLDTYFEKIKELSDTQIHFLGYLLKALVKENSPEDLLNNTLSLFEKNKDYDFAEMENHSSIFIFLHETTSLDIYFEKLKQLSHAQINFLSYLLEAFDKNNPPKDLLNNALSWVEKNNEYSAIGGYTTIFVFLYETKLLDIYFEQIKQLSDTQIGFLSYLLMTFGKDNSSEDLLSNALSLVEKYKAYNCESERDSIHAVCDTFFSARRAPTSPVVFLKLIESHIAPRDFITALDKILSETSSQKMAFFPNKNHPDFLMVYLKREYIKNGGSAMNDIFSNCNTFADAISTLGNDQSNCTNITECENSAAYKTLALFGGLEKLKTIILDKNRLICCCNKL